MFEMNPNSPNPLSVKIDANPVFAGLDDFLKGLERLFFADATAKVWVSANGSQDLVLHIKSPIQLLEVLHHHRRGHWGARPTRDDGARVSRLEEMLQILESRNGRPVDIEELSLELNDILIVIRKSGLRSIAGEFDLLLESLAAHFVYLTQGMRQMPYEIYIPVVEEGEFPLAPAKDATASDFYAYWGVYFETEDDARIYDLRTRKILDSTSLEFYSPLVR